MTDKFTILKKLLKALGLSEERVEELIAWIETWLQDDHEDEGESAKSQTERYPYGLKNAILTSAEQQFFQALLPATAPWAVVCPKVRLSDIFYTKGMGNRRWTPESNRINQKHIDFLLCDPQTMQPLLGVELNDRSHQRADRRKRDRFVVGVFDAVGLPLVGIPVGQHYDAAELGRFLRAKAGVSRTATTAPAATPSAPKAVPEPPTCPQCGAAMVQRQAKRGPNAGKPFWGCSNFPKCRGILAFDEGAGVVQETE